MGWIQQVLAVLSFVTMDVWGVTRIIRGLTDVANGVTEIFEGHIDSMPHPGNFENNEDALVDLRSVVDTHSSVEQNLHMSTGSKAKWATPFVIVPAMWAVDETSGIPRMPRLDDLPEWMVQIATEGNAEITSAAGTTIAIAPNRYSLYLYQRVDQKKPRYCVNHAFDAGVASCFIDDFYSNLPDVVIFTHMKPEGEWPDHHNPLFAEFVGCLKPTLSYTTLVPYFIAEKSAIWHGMAHSESVWHENCLRDVLALAGIHPRQDEDITTQYYCCEELAVSRDQLRTHSHSFYKQLRQLILSPEGICHKGKPEEKNLFMTTKAAAQLYNFRYEEHRDIPPEPVGYDPSIAGLAMESVVHHILGGKPLIQKRYTQEEWCESFETDCLGSPCTSNVIKQRAINMLGQPYAYNTTALVETMIARTPDEQALTHISSWKDNPDEDDQTILNRFFASHGI